MWNRIMLLVEWFGDATERYRLVKNFNDKSKESFIVGTAPTLLEAKITKGDPNFRHQFSKFRAGGFRIKALSGKPLQRSEMIEIGKIIIDNNEFTRKLISMGWDTLEVHADKGKNGLKWELQKHANITGYLD